MRKKIVAANWKMNLDYEEGLNLFSEILDMVENGVTGAQEIIVCSPFIHLQSLVQMAKSCADISIGAQNVHQAEAGAYTGEVSTKMIKSVGADYVIVGHSERRHYANETNQLLAEKVNALLKSGLMAIFCVGETFDDRTRAVYLKVISTQLTESLFHLDSVQFGQIVIAYEPIWAIGKGKTASVKQVQEMHKFIRGQITQRYDQSIGERTTILYGGSLNSKNAAELFDKPDIDGGLVGGASLNSKEFMEIIKAFNLQ